MPFLNRWRSTLFTRVNFTIFALLAISYLSLNQYVAGRAKWVHSPLDVGDWLINYQGGFVRRGLAGQIFYRLFSGAHHDLGLTVMVFEAVVLTLVAITVGYLVLGSKSPWVAWIVLSPVAFVFSAYDTPGGFRKENLLILALALAAVATRTTPRLANFWLGVALAVFVLVLFSWEPAAFSLPVAWWTIGRTRLSPRHIRNWRYTWVTIGLVGFALSVLFHGSAHQTSAICQSLLTHHLSVATICTGSVQSLSITTGTELTFVGAHFPHYLWYIPWYLLTLLPFLFSGWLRRHWRIASAVGLANFLLFVAGSDYGRWIHILGASLALVWLTSDDRLHVGTKPSWRERIALVAFISLWSAPWSGNPELWKGLAVSAYRNLSHPIGFYYPWFYSTLVHALFH
jgi:hypothetical protein